ncbi:MAG TPA: phage major capsid protein [bacterium]|nr:phage major capsid protein [bacterium]
MITTDKLIDLITMTLKDLGKLRWTNLATNLQEYIALSRLLNKHKVKFDSGTGIQWNVMVGFTQSAKTTGLYAVDSVNVGDAMKTASIPWRHITTNFPVDRREVTMNSGASKIVDLIETRRAQMMIDLADFMEKIFWGKPEDSSDELTPFGVKYWITPNASQGFNGGNPAGFSAGPGNLDCTLYPNWKNYTDTYSEISSTDLFQKLRRAATFTNFKSPARHADYEAYTKYEYFTNWNVLGEIERMLETRNDNLGSDIVKYNDQALFRRTPITWVPYLESDTSNPFYGINWGVFQPVFLRGEYMREETKAAPNQHTVAVTHLDTTLNFKCTNRRRLFVLYEN